MNGRYENNIWIGSDCKECQGRRFVRQSVLPTEARSFRGCELWSKDSPCTSCNEDGSAGLDTKVGTFEQPIFLGHFYIIEPKMFDKKELTVKAMEMPLVGIWGVQY